MKMTTGNQIVWLKRGFVLCYSILQICIGLSAQDFEEYQIDGAMLGNKINRQISQSMIEHTPSAGRVETWFGTMPGDYRGNHNFTSFVGAMDGAMVGSLAHEYTYQNYYNGPRGINSRNVANASTDISSLEIANITYADEDGDGDLGKDEEAQVYFDLINTGDEDLYRITPLLMCDITQHTRISSPCTIDTLEAHHAIKYVIELKGNGKRCTKKRKLLLRIKYGSGQYADVIQIVLGTKRRNNENKTE